MSVASPRVSIILPCFNEGPQIVSSLTRLDEWFGSAAEVLVVDDGSADETFERAAAYAQRHAPVHVHRLPVHVGKGAAIRAAIPLARGPLVVLLDADLAYDRDSVERVLAGLETADMVVGNRRHHDSRYSVPVRLFGFLYRRHLVGMAFNACVRTLVPLELRDTQCGLKGFRRDALRQVAAALSTRGFTLDVEMLLVARALGLRRIEVPVCVTYHSGKSSIKLLESSFTMVTDLIRIAVRHARGHYAPERLRAAANSATAGVESPPIE